MHTLLLQFRTPLLKLQQDIVCPKYIALWFKKTGWQFIGNSLK